MIVVVVVVVVVMMMVVMVVVAVVAVEVVVAVVAGIRGVLAVWVRVWKVRRNCRGRCCTIGHSSAADFRSSPVGVSVQTFGHSKGEKTQDSEGRGPFDIGEGLTEALSFVGYEGGGGEQCSVVD